jgi:hypothetical protein
MLTLFYEVNNLNYDRNSSPMDLLDSQAQLDWYFNFVLGHWVARYTLPLVMILTKWGYCLNFNMLLASEFLHLDR